LSAAEEDQGRNGFDSVRRRGRRIIIHIQLYYCDAFQMLFGDRVDRRRQHPARRAPGSPKIDQHWFFGFQNFVLKRIVGYFFNSLTHFCSSFLTSAYLLEMLESLCLCLLPYRSRLPRHKPHALNFFPACNNSSLSLVPATAWDKESAPYIK